METGRCQWPDGSWWMMPPFSGAEWPQTSGPMQQVPCDFFKRGLLEGSGGFEKKTYSWKTEKKGWNGLGLDCFLFLRCNLAPTTSAAKKLRIDQSDQSNACIESTSQDHLLKFRRETPKVKKSFQNDMISHTPPPDFWYWTMFFLCPFQWFTCGLGWWFAMPKADFQFGSLWIPRICWFHHQLLLDASAGKSHFPQIFPKILKSRMFDDSMIHRNWVVTPNMCNLRALIFLEI